MKTIPKKLMLMTVSLLLLSSTFLQAASKYQTQTMRPSTIKHSTAVMPAKTVRTGKPNSKMSKSAVRSKRLLILGQRKSTKEATLGTNPKLRGKTPTGKSTAPKEAQMGKRHKAIPITLKQKKFSTAKSFQIKRNNEFKTPIQTKARKPLFKYKGISRLNVKPMKLTRKQLLVPKIKIVQVAHTPTEDQRPDLVLDKLEHINSHGQVIPLNNIRKSSAGKWLRFRIRIKNNGKTTARRIDITAKHLGQEWPTEDVHLVKRAPGGASTVTVRVLIPQTAVVRSGHQLRFSVDPERVNPDKIWSNNTRTLTFRLREPVEPDLYLTKLNRKKVDDHLDWGPAYRGWIKYKYEVEIRNRGNASAPATSLAFKVQKVDHRDNHPAPFLHKNWAYSIPRLTLSNRKHSFNTDTWKVYTDQTCRLDAVIDPNNNITELSKTNNHGSKEFSVSVRNPFAGTFLAGLFEATYDAFIQVGDAIYDGATWAYNGIKAGSQYALAGVIVPEMLAWVQTSYGIHYHQGRFLNNREKQLLRPYFPESLISKTKIQLSSSWTRPELWGDGAGVTFSNGFTGNSIFVIQRENYSDTILVHEMVHAYQYKKLGLAKFCWRYIYTWVKSGFKYRKISLEKQAYGFEGQVRNGSTERIETFLGY